MNPTPKISPSSRQGEAARLHACWEYAERFVPHSEHADAARRASAELGITPVTQGGAALLTFVAKLIGARAVAEIGTGVGVSGLALLAGMDPEGVLTSIDSENEHESRARALLRAADIPNRRARLIAGNALQVLPKLSDGAYDIVFVDGDPLEYVEYVAQGSRLLRAGGLLVLNHAFADGAVADGADEEDNTVIIREALAAVRDLMEFTPIVLPVGDGMLLASRR